MAYRHHYYSRSERRQGPVPVILVQLLNRPPDWHGGLVVDDDGTPRLPSDLLALVAAYVDVHGTESLEMALACGHLFEPTMRQASRRALQHSAEHAQDGDAHTLVWQLVPRAKEAGRRIDVRLTSGPVDVVLRAPLERAS